MRLKRDGAFRPHSQFRPHSHFLYIIICPGRQIKCLPRLGLVGVLRNALSKVHSAAAAGTAIGKRRKHQYNCGQLVHRVRPNSE